MTPIYGRAPWHNPPCHLVPLRAKTAKNGTGWHAGGTHPVPLFEVIYREKWHGGTGGTTARMSAKKSGDVGKSRKKGHYLHLTINIAFLLCRCATPKHLGHIWGYQEA